MEYEELVSAVKGPSFLPLRLHLTNGEVYELTHPNNILIRRRVAAIAVGESIHLLALQHIAQVLPLVDAE